MVDTKAWYASKTIWVAIVTAGLGIVSSIIGQPVTQAETLTVMGFVFLILRLVTNNQIQISTNGTTPLP